MNLYTYTPTPVVTTFTTTAPTKSELSGIAKKLGKPRAHTVARIAENDLAELIMRIVYQPDSAALSDEQIGKKFGISATQFKHLQYWASAPLRHDGFTIEAMIEMLAHAGYDVTFQVSRRK
jgi:predicted XRE-type DNA-binding protein